MKSSSDWRSLWTKHRWINSDCSPTSRAAKISLEPRLKTSLMENMSPCTSDLSHLISALELDEAYCACHLLCCVSLSICLSKYILKLAFTEVVESALGRLSAWLLVRLSSRSENDCHGKQCDQSLDSGQLLSESL